MEANKFIKKFGLGAAQCVLENMPRTSTHYVFNKTGFYHALEHNSYFHEGEWFDSDYATVEEMEEDYRGNVVCLVQLKKLTAAHELVESKWGLNTAKSLVQRAEKLKYQLEQKGFDMNGVPNRAIDELSQAIADVESCQ